MHSSYTSFASGRYHETFQRPISFSTCLWTTISAMFAQELLFVRERYKRFKQFLERKIFSNLHQNIQRAVNGAFQGTLFTQMVINDEIISF